MKLLINVKFIEGPLAKEYDLDNTETEKPLLEADEFVEVPLGPVHNLAISYSEVDRRSRRCCSWWRRLAAARKRTLGKEHPDTLISKDNLAIMMSNSDHFQKTSW